MSLLPPPTPSAPVATPEPVAAAPVAASPVATPKSPSGISAEFDIEAGEVVISARVPINKVQKRYSNGNDPDTVETFYFTTWKGRGKFIDAVNQIGGHTPRIDLRMKMVREFNPETDGHIPTARPRR
jgi:hypothetical protein